jgi:hypothetical protein
MSSTEVNSEIVALVVLSVSSFVITRFDRFWHLQRSFVSIAQANGVDRLQHHAGELSNPLLGRPRP